MVGLSSHACTTSFSPPTGRGCGRRRTGGGGAEEELGLGPPCRLQFVNLLVHHCRVPLADLSTGEGLWRSGEEEGGAEELLQHELKKGREKDEWWRRRRGEARVREGG